MKHMKYRLRLTALLITVVLLAAMLIGCNADSEPVTEDPAVQETADPAPAGTPDTIATADGRNLSLGLVNVCYAEARQNLIQSLGTLYTMVLDPQTPLSEQAFMNSSYPTWGDYLLDAAVKNAAELYRVSDHAAANGFALTEEQIAAIDREIEKAEEFAATSQNKYSDGSAFLASVYGEGTTTETYREYLILRATSDQYMANYMASLQFTEEDADAYYAADPQSFDEVSFQLFDLSARLTASEENPMEACLELAESMASAITDEKSFNEQCKRFVSEEDYKYYDNGAITYFRDKTYEELGKSAVYRDWLFDPARQPGDVACISYQTEKDQGWYVLRFAEKTDLHYATVNFHQMVVDCYETDPDTVAKARETAEVIYDAVQGEDVTEDTFLSLMKRNPGGSDYTGTYENTAHGALRNAYDTWIFDPARQPGDITLLQSEQGFHVIYFSSKGQSHYLIEVMEAMREDAFNTWLAEVLAGLSPVTDPDAAAAFNKY